MKNYVAPDLNSVMQILKDDIMASIKCLNIGEVQEFDAKTRTITAKIVLAPLDTDMNLAVSNSEEDGLQYPILYQVPVLDCEYFSPPIHKGDYCLLIFCDRNIDGWLVDDNNDYPPNDGRKHNINDAFAWFGIGNYWVSSFIRPDNYNPPHDLPEICDCPIPKYGYQPNYARFRYENGEIDLGLEPTKNAGVTIVARDYSNVVVFAEGSDGNNGAGNVMFFPTNSFHINNGLVNYVVHGDSDMAIDPDSTDANPTEQSIGGKISMYNPKESKIIEDEEHPESWWNGKRVYTSDMYRIMAWNKTCLDQIYKEFCQVWSAIEGGDPETKTPKVYSEGDILEFKTRYKALFAPGPPEEGN